MIKSYLTSLAFFYESIEIPMCVATADGRVIATHPSTEMPFLPDYFIRICIEDFEMQKRDIAHPLVLLMEPSYFLGVAMLSEDLFLIFGPAGPFTPSQEHMLSFSVNVIHPEKLAEFCNLLSRAPTVTYRKFINALSIAISLYTGELTPLDQIILCNNTAQKKEAETAMREQLFAQREHAIAHTPQSYELGVLAAIEAGDLPLLKRRIIEPVTGRIGQMARDVLTQEKYTFVSFITMITRAAIKGGMNTEAACSLSDIYCQQMDAMTRVQDISALVYQMALDFCGKVAEEDDKKLYSPVVQKLCDYISAHLHEDIKLTDLAGHVDLCTRTVSIKFREETGLPISDYIHKQKMREAAYLLAHSEYSISDICAFLQYSSQSYFTKVFKDIHGVTPQHYRERRKSSSGS